MNIQFDLNNLRYLNTLLKTKNVSKAAEKLGITQPALSNTLAKLRNQFDDNLLVRNGQKMELTLKASDLAPKLSYIIDQIEDLISNTDKFDPKKTSINFNFASSDYASLILVPYLVEFLKKDYPNIKIHVHKLIHNEIQNSLSDLSVNFVLGTGFKTDIPSSLYAKTLFQDEFAVAVSKNHPRIKKKLTLKNYLNEEHIFVAPSGLNTKIIDQKLTILKKKRNIALTLPHISVACHSLVKSNYLLTLPKKALEIMSSGLDIVVLPLPIEVPHIDITVIWHERTHNHDAHKWMRTLLSEINFK